MVDAIYSFLMKLVHDRSKSKQRKDNIADVPFHKFSNRLITSRRYQVFESSNGIYQVQIPDTGVKYVCDLKERYCDCMNFGEYLSPCAYAIVACRHESEDAFEYFIPQYTTLAYNKTYEHFLILVSIENLEPDDEILPPVFQKQRGRPKTKRIRKGA
jgi:hypothetical protein